MEEREGKCYQAVLDWGSRFLKEEATFSLVNQLQRRWGGIVWAVFAGLSAVPGLDLSHLSHQLLPLMRRAVAACLLALKRISYACWDGASFSSASSWCSVIEGELSFKKWANSVSSNFLQLEEQELNPGWEIAFPPFWISAWALLCQMSSAAGFGERWFLNILNRYIQ